MKKSDLVLIEGGKVEVPETPDRVDFTCHHCKMPCVMYPRSTPIATMHAVPGCTEWAKVEGKRDDLARFLIKCGVHVHVPGSIVPN